MIPASGKVLSGGLDSNAPQKPKRFFGAAPQHRGRRIADHSWRLRSSTPVHAWTTSSSRSSRGPATWRSIWIASSPTSASSRRSTSQKSGTRKEELLIIKEDLNRVWVLRKVLNPLRPLEAMELLLDKMGKTHTNADFLSAMQKMG